ncbi:tyrosine-type recombinase/integrase [Erwinia sp. CPCC 100877]|nr:tyrosine-type recombinase/integrase [Erwinia sp. CPCC 100877]
MARKGENIYKRKDGRWEARYIKRRMENGRIFYGSVYAKTYREVKTKVTILKAKHLETPQNFTSPYAGTLTDWMIYWLTTKARNKVKATTYSNYCRLAKRHILPSIGKHMLVKITAKELQTYVYELQRKQLSPGSIKNIFAIVRKCLSEAKKQGYLAENPCLYIELPKDRRKEVSVLTLEQQKRIERLAMKEENCSPVMISLYSGLRIGEISGLRWSDIDFKNDLIYVRRTVSRIVNEDSTTSKTVIIEDTPKSVYSFRQIPIATNFKQYLLEKARTSKSAYVISSDDKPTEPRTITNRFKKIVQLADISHVNFHVLRHTFATRCIEQGFDAASLSKILGHQSTKITLDTYTGSLLETRRKAMSSLDQLFEIK